MSRLSRFGVPVLLVLAAFAYGWGIWDVGYGYPYYSAAVKSMSQGWVNFVFGSVDGLGSVTVDKPPMALWVQVVAVKVLGLHGWVLVLPQVVEGVATVWLLFLTVRLWRGDRVALLAGVIYLTTPVAVALVRDNMPDPLMMLLVVGAAYAVTRAVRDGVGERRWVLVAALLLGCAFTTKMVQAWLVLPAVVAAYLVGSRSSWRVKGVTTGLAGGVLLVASLWWVVLVDLWPGRTPYIGSSTDGSARDLVLGYNGFGRVLGQDYAAAASYAEEHGKSFYQSDPGVGRLFGSSLGGQASWLLPLAMAAVVVAVVLAFRRAVSTREDWAGWCLWGGWLVVSVVVYSWMRGIWLLYYTATLAPAIAALAAAALSVLWRRDRVLFAVAVLGTGAWAWVLVRRDTEWLGWLAHVVLGLTLVAVVAVLVTRRRGGLLAGLAAVLVVPTAWSAATAVGYSAALPMLPAAGPVSLQVDYLPEDLREDFTSTLSGWGAARLRADAGLLDQGGRALLSYVERSDARVKLAVETADEGARYVLATDSAVAVMGGFTNRDAAPAPDEVRGWIERGELGFVLLVPERTGQYEFVRDRCRAVTPQEYGGQAFGDLYACR